MFKGNHFLILPNGMGKSRADLFRSSAIKNGAESIVPDDVKSTPLVNFIPNHRYIVVYDEQVIQNWTSLEKILAKKKCFDIKTKDKYVYLPSKWLSECLKSKKLISIESHQLKPESTSSDKESKKAESEKLFANIDNQIVNTSSNIPISNASLNIDFKRSRRQVSHSDSESEEKKSNIKKSKLMSQLNPDSSYSEGESDQDERLLDINSSQDYFEKELKSQASALLEKKTKFWTCAHSSKEQPINYNKQITDKLEEMLSIYESTKDKFRALSYQKAIAALKRRPHPISTYEEAMSIPGVGKRIAEKIWEIVETGNFTKLSELSSRDDINAMKLFTTVHGIGPTLAQSFITQGFRTIEDLRTKAQLTKQQKIGLKHYEEFQQRIPRDEVKRIEAVVKKAALELNSGLIVETCGSYRRGKATCGDVDILITHPDGHSQKKIFNKLIERLHESGFLTDDLAVQDDSDSQRKYLGVCRLPEPGSLHRRLDIISVPYDEFGCALLYFTGSAHFNRSMRHLARKLGMSLSEKSLNKNIIRKGGGEKINVGEKLHTPTEQDVFKVLNLTYRPPEERDF